MPVDRVQGGAPLLVRQAGPPGRHEATLPWTACTSR
jgi:hypothetical protein